MSKTETVTCILPVGPGWLRAVHAYSIQTYPHLRLVVVDPSKMVRSLRKDVLVTAEAVRWVASEVADPYVSVWKPEDFPLPGHIAALVKAIERFGSDGAYSRSVWAADGETVLGACAGLRTDASVERTPWEGGRGPAVQTEAMTYIRDGAAEMAEVFTEDVQYRINGLMKIPRLKLVDKI